MSRTATGEMVMSRITNTVAAGGVTMPVWWPSLGDVAGVSAQLVPILSAVWLVIQIIGYVRKTWRARQ